MQTLKARFTLNYSLIVLVVTAGLSGLAWYMIAVRGMGWTLTPEVFTITKHTVELALLSLLLLAVFATQVWDLIRPRDILTLTPHGIHDRRLTRGEVRWDQVAHVHLYRKGWQWMVRLEPKDLTARPDALKLGPMPVYAFNRMCARWLKRPELNVGLGGMTVTTRDLVDYIGRHYKGDITQEP